MPVRLAWRCDRWIERVKSYAVITAPFSCIVTARLIELGEIAAPGV